MRTKEYSVVVIVFYWLPLDATLEHVVYSILFIIFFFVKTMVLCGIARADPVAVRNNA